MSVIRILHPLEIREYETPPLFDSFNLNTGLKFQSRPINKTTVHAVETGDEPTRHQVWRAEKTGGGITSSGEFLQTKYLKISNGSTKS